LPLKRLTGKAEFPPDKYLLQRSMVNAGKVAAMLARLLFFRSHCYSLIRLTAFIAIWEKTVNGPRHDRV
jgi:hypothetical protein